YMDLDPFTGEEVHIARGVRDWRARLAETGLSAGAEDGPSSRHEAQRVRQWSLSDGSDHSAPSRRSRETQAAVCEKVCRIGVSQKVPQCHCWPISTRPRTERTPVAASTEPGPRPWPGCSIRRACRRATTPSPPGIATVPSRSTWPHCETRRPPEL